MDSKATRISIFIVIICVAFILFNTCKPVSTSPKYYPQEKQIDSINVLINQLSKQQSHLSTLVSTQQHKIDSISTQISVTKTQIFNVKKYYGDKIKNINSYTDSQLSGFFANRYK